MPFTPEDSTRSRRMSAVVDLYHHCARERRNRVALQITYAMAAGSILAVVFFWQHG